MKIMVCGSMGFAKQMVEAQKQLESMGHTTFVSEDVQNHLDGSLQRDDLERDYDYCMETGIMKKCFSKISGCDAILVMNLPKNGVEGYIGTATLMEMGIAYFLGKKIYLLNKTPTPAEARWAHEVRIIQPTVLNNDLTKVGA